jgi:DNA-binding beta-propeller fold protein YncE
MCDFHRRVLMTVGYMLFCVGMMHAGNDMSLPDVYSANPQMSKAMAVRSLTPPLVAAFAAPDGAMRGLAYDGQYLWAANSGDGNSIYGSKIYRLDPDSGTVVSTFYGPSDFSCGLAWDGEYLWYSAYITGMIFQLDTSAMIVIKAFTAPTSYPFDLAWDGTYLYAVKGNQIYISVIDTSNGQEIDSIAATYSSPNVRPFGLTFLPRNAPQLLTSDGNYGSNLVNTWNFYAGAWVDQWASEPASYPSGLAYDSVTERLWVSCYERDSIYVYDVSQVGILSDDPVVAELSGIEVYPNPFSHKTKIRYTIHDPGCMPGEARLNVYDATGRLVKSFYLESSIVNHESAVWWDGTDEDGRSLPMGVYFVATSMRNRMVKLVKSKRSGSDLDY